MKALFISNDPKLFNPDSAVRARMREYARAIGELYIISPGPEVEPFHERFDGVALTIYSVSGSRLAALLKTPSLARELIRREGIQVVSAQDPFEQGWVAARAVRGTDARLHIQVHTDFLSPWFTRGFSKMAWINRIRVRLANGVLPQAHAIRVVSVRVRNRMVAKYGIRIPKPSILPIPTPLVEVAPVPFPENTFAYKLLAVGRLEEEKRFADVIRALTGVHVRYPSTALYIVDQGRLRERLEKLANELGVADRVIFLGHRTDVRGLMKSADALVNTSAYEGYSLVLLEAALAGLPIVTTDVGLVGEVLKKDNDVRVVPIANPTALAHELVDLLGNEDKRKALAAHAQQAAREYMQRSAITPQEVAHDLARALAWKPSLLVTTQVMDHNDANLGFFHTWVAKLAPHYERIEVICLYKGECSLPENVRVHSLGKEKGERSQLKYALTFLDHAWRLRHAYKAVFVHMNQEYILLAGWFWKLQRKRIYLWRNHYAGTWLTDLAAAFCTKVFCTSKHSYTAKYKKTMLMPVGVDLERFSLDESVKREPRSILFFSRISPSKRPDMFIDALGLLLAKSISFIASMYGSPKQEDVTYYESLKARAESLGLRDRLRFHAGVPNVQAPSVYRAHDIFVNCSPSGMFDKMLFEAAACGCSVVTSSKDFAELAGADTYFDSEQLLEERLAAILASENRSAVVPGYIFDNSLEALIRKLVQMVS